MYERWFGLQRAPFENVPDTGFFFGSGGHNEALAQLVCCIEQRKGFAMLSGEIGAGKTTVTRALFKRLDARTVTASITNSHLTGVQLLQTVAREFGIEGVKPQRPELLEAINRFLVDRLAEDRNVVLLVDEAQDLPLATLEELRLISNLETEREKLIQILIVGQPELRAKIDHPGLRQLRQRLALRYHLKGLSLEETRNYIAHRLQIAGAAGAVRFSERAVNTIWRYSKGIPRLINLSCDKTLLVAFTEQTRKLEQSTVMSGLREIEGEEFDFHAREEEEAQERAGPRRTFLRMPFFGSLRQG
jgi:general secretion pathway protein A